MDKYNNFSSTTEYRNFLDRVYVDEACNKHKISVIICRYNTPMEFLFRAIESALYGGHENVEVVVVDDGSSISAENDINERFFSIREKIKFYYKENEGLGLSRNYGIKKSSGEYIFFLDADDTVEINGLKRLIAHAIHFNVVMTVGKRVLCDEQGVPTNAVHNDYHGQTYKVVYNNEANDAFNDQMVNNKLILKDVLYEKNIWFEPGVYEDIDYTAILYSRIEEYHYINVHVHNWYKYGENTTLSSNVTVKNLDERIKKMERAWIFTPEFIRKQRLDFIVKFAFINYFSCYFNYTLEEQKYIWEEIYRFFDERRSYFEGGRIQGKAQNIKVAIELNDYDLFCKTIKREYYFKRVDEPYNNYVVNTREEAYYALINAKRHACPARLFVVDDTSEISKKFIKAQKKNNVFESVNIFENGNIVMALNEAIEKCREDEYLLKPTYLYVKYADIFRNCNLIKDTIYIFSEDEPYGYYINRAFSNVKTVKIGIVDKIIIFLYRTKLRISRNVHNRH